jgi:hypothetical protein
MSPASILGSQSPPCNSGIGRSCSCSPSWGLTLSRRACTRRAWISRLCIRSTAIQELVAGRSRRIDCIGGSPSASKQHPTAVQVRARNWSRSMLDWSDSRSAVGSDKGIIDRAPTHRRGFSLRRHNVNLRARLMLRLPKSRVLVTELSI